MKKLFLFQLCALLLIVLMSVASGIPTDDKVVVADLMKDRIGILSYYYGGKMSFEDARKNMAKVTAESLLKEDVALMKGLSKSEIDQITDYSIEILSCQRTSYGIIKGEARVSWVLLGPDGYWETEEEYYFTADCDAEGTKLTQLKKL